MFCAWSEAVFDNKRMNQSFEVADFGALQHRCLHFHSSCMSMVLHLAVSDLKSQQYTPCAHHGMPKSMMHSITFWYMTMSCDSTLSVKMQGCLRDDTLTCKALLEGLDYNIEEEATWAREMVTELYPTCHDVQTLLLTKLCSDGDVSFALGSLQMYYDVVGDMPELSKLLLEQLLTVPGEWLFMHLHTVRANQHVQTLYCECLWCSQRN